jgi:hypothetical protein
VALGDHPAMVKLTLVLAALADVGGVARGSNGKSEHGCPAGLPKSCCRCKIGKVRYGFSICALTWAEAVREVLACGTMVLELSARGILLSIRAKTSLAIFYREFCRCRDIGGPVRRHGSLKAS